MGRRQIISKEKRRMLLGLLAAAGVMIGAFAVGMSVLGQESEPVRAAKAPEVEGAPEVADGSMIEAQARVAGLAAKTEAEKQAAAEAEAAAETEAAAEAARDQEARRDARREARQEARQASVRAPAPESTPAPVEPNMAVPADTTMYLTVPTLGLNDIPVVEGTTESSLSQGAGHLSGSGYPWVEGSNTYIAGHRIGYPGTMSDRVFYSLPNLAAGDEILLTDANGQTYTYAVSEILEVPITDLSVTYPIAGRDMVTLQTCIEDFGDYWTEGPNWLVRYVVRADRVS